MALQRWARAGTFRPQLQYLGISALLPRRSMSQRRTEIPEEGPSPQDVIKDYHNGSKHHFRRYAPGPRGLDWANQPNPYRCFKGAKEVSLGMDLPKHARKMLYGGLFEGAKEARQPEPMTSDSISSFLYHSMALSAKKVVGPSSWCLRVNPSSGNLHPTEAYIAAKGSQMEGSADDAPSGGLYHYRPDKHAVERRCEFEFDNLRNEVRVNGSGAGELFGNDFFLVMLTSIHWRESWKYGMRAWRYCNHDVGHAAAALQLAAKLNGWEIVFFVPIAGTEALAGLDRDCDFPVDNEREHLDMVGIVIPASKRAKLGDTVVVDIEPSGILAVGSGQWHGVAEALSLAHGNEWPEIDRVEAVTALPSEATEEQMDCRVSDAGRSFQQSKSHYMVSRKQLASEMIRQRRSAQEMLPERSKMLTNQFYGTLARLVPSMVASPWSSIQSLVEGSPRVHLLLFVHRIKGMRPGLLFLGRDLPEEQLNELKASSMDKFLWERPDDAPEGLQLYRLLNGDARQAGKDLSCGQDIAGDGCFAAAMMADTRSVFSGTCHPHMYKQLYWESGVIGQVLYLEAEANGLRGTGIGCFFDDPTHQLFYGQPVEEMTEEMPLQSIYHFAFGYPTRDSRLRTVDPYAKE